MADPAPYEKAPSLSPASTDPSRPGPLPTPGIYKVGTLTYTKMGLIMLFVWLLWGDLIWTLMETVFESSMSLQLDRIGVPMEWIGYVKGTVGASITMVMVPIISFRSDRTRTPWGRRIPYLLVTMPFLCVFLTLLGFSDSIGAWIKSSDWPSRLHLSPVAVIIIVMGSLIVLYDIFNSFVNSIFWYLFRDVVPPQFMGRFMAAFRMVGGVANSLWGWFVYGHIETHTRYIYAGAAVLYFFGFGLMCFMVKEGKYSPPTDVAPGSWLTRTSSSIRTYFRECYTNTHPLFIAFYISQAMFAFANACGMYKQFLYIRHLGFSLEALGRIGAIIAPFALLAQVPLGWLVDKIHPMRGSLIACTCVIPMHFAGYFLGDYSIAGFTISAFALYVTILLVQIPFTMLNGASDIPLIMRLFPQKQFGQFSSANSMLRSFTNIFGTFAGATFMGYMNRKYGYAGNAFAFLWHGTFQTCAVACLWVVFFIWKRSGAEKFTYDAELYSRPSPKSVTSSLP